jgi:hypothetical protein
LTPAHKGDLGGMSTGALLRALGRGAAAGVAGTVAMTAVQLGVRWARGQSLGTPVPDTWAEAPAPAQVAKRVADAVGQGRRITKQQVPLATNVMHWLYGVGWGVAFGLAARSARPSPLVGGAVFGAGVWASSYAELVPLGIYEAPWRYPAPELALDLSYHLAYGIAVASAHAALEP